MGRRKIPFELIADETVRRSTYVKRMKGLKKKAHELNVLCGIEVLVLSYGPRGNLPNTFPEDNRHASNIVGRFSGLSLPERTRHAETLDSVLAKDLKKKKVFVPEPNHVDHQLLFDDLPVESVIELAAALDFKIDEVKQKIEFLKMVSKEQERERDQLIINNACDQQQQLEYVGGGGGGGGFMAERGSFYGWWAGGYCVNTGVLPIASLPLPPPPTLNYGLIDPWFQYELQQEQQQLNSCEVHE